MHVYAQQTIEPSKTRLQERCKSALYREYRDKQGILGPKDDDPLNITNGRQLENLFSAIQITPSPISRDAEALVSAPA